MITLTQTDWTTVKLVSDGTKHTATPMSPKQLRAFLASHEKVVEGTRPGATVGVYRRKK